MRQRSRNSCRPFGTSDAPSSRTTGSRPWLHLIVPPGLNHSPRNHVDGVPPMVSLIKILNGVAQRGSTTQPGVAVATAHPRRNRTGPFEPRRGSTATPQFPASRQQELWNPVGVRGEPDIFTWGAPQRGDPRLRCETRSGLSRTIFRCAPSVKQGEPPRRY